MTQYERTREPPPQSQKFRVVLMAVFFTSITLGSLGLISVAVYELVRGDGGFVVMLIVGSFLFLLMGYWARHYLRDLRAKPIALEGEVLKKWHKGNLLVLFFPSYYILVERVVEDLVEQKIFSIHRNDYALLLEADLVRVTCYPHSLTVEQVERFDEVEKKFIPARSAG